MATQTHIVSAVATFINADVIPSNIAQTLIDSLTSNHSTRGVNPVSIPSLTPPACALACTVKLGSDGFTNTINLQIVTDVSITDAQIATAMTTALLALAAKNPATGSVWGNIGPVTVLSVNVF